ncbi:MAG: hypothetical protein Q8L47_02540 [bacterium]|nr:hypothetical protein [bacterium]
MEPNLNKEVESFPQSDIERIGQQVERLKSTPEFRSAKPSEIVKESIKQVYPQISVSSAVTQATTDHDEDTMLPSYMKNDSDADKAEVEALIHIAFTLGIEASINEARKHRARILDDLHDALTEKVMTQIETHKK